MYSSTSLRRCRTLDMNWTAEWQDGGETGGSKSSGRGWNLVSLCSTCLSFTREKGCWAWGWSGGLYRASGGRWTKCSAAFLRLISNWKQIYGVMTVCAAAYDSFSKRLLILCIYIAYWWFYTRLYGFGHGSCRHENPIANMTHHGVYYVYFMSSQSLGAVRSWRVCLRPVSRRPTATFYWERWLKSHSLFL